MDFLTLCTITSFRLLRDDVCQDLVHVGNMVTPLVVMDFLLSIQPVSMMSVKFWYSTMFQNNYTTKARSTTKMCYCFSSTIQSNLRDMINTLIMMLRDFSRICILISSSADTIDVQCINIKKCKFQSTRAKFT